MNARRWGYSISTLVLASAVFATGVANEGCTMTTSQDIAERVLSISESRYEDPDEDFTDRELALAETDWTGIAIAAPSAVDLSRQSEIPMLVARKHSGLRGAEVPNGQNSLLIAIDTTRRRIHIANMYPMPAGKTPVSNPSPPAMPTGASAIAEVSLVERMDARALLGLEVVPADYRITALTFDWISNSIAVRVTSDGAVAPSTAFALSDPIAAGTRRGLPTWLATSESPTPTDSGTPAAAFRMVPGTAPAPRLKAIGTITVTGDAMLVLKSPYVMDEVGGVRKSVVAHVPATLAVVMKNGPGPIRRDFVIPIYADRPVVPGDRLTGHFALDVLADGQAALQPGAYAAYLVLEGHTFGPVAFTRT